MSFAAGHQDMSGAYPTPSSCTLAEENLASREYYYWKKNGVSSRPSIRVSSTCPPQADDTARHSVSLLEVVGSSTWVFVIRATGTSRSSFYSPDRPACLRHPRLSQSVMTPPSTPIPLRSPPRTGPVAQRWVYRTRRQPPPGALYYL